MGPAGYWVLGIGGEHDVRFPATGMLLLYSVLAGRRGQAATTMDDPRVAGVVGTWSSAAAKIQNSRNPENPEMPEWLERKRIKSKTSAVCGTNLARCWLRIIIATHLPQARAKRYRRILFFLPPRRLSTCSFIKKSASHRPLPMRRLSTHPSPLPSPPCPTWKNGC